MHVVLLKVRDPNPWNPANITVCSWRFRVWSILLRDRALTWATGPGNLAKIIDFLDLGDVVPSIEPWLRGRKWPGSHADTRAQEAVEQYREHEQGEGHVQPIAFDGESYDGEGYARDGGGNEE